MAKHRDKTRIKPFCDQLAQLWETHSPDLRFGQIISCLPLAIDRPGHDPFFWKRMKCWRPSSARSAKREKPCAPWTRRNWRA